MVTFGAIAPVGAQSVVTSVSIADIKASCHAQGSDQACIAAVQAYIADVKAAGLTPDQTDALLAQLVVELGSIASGLPADVRARVANAISVIANEIADPNLAARLQVAAANVQAGIDVGPGDVQASPA
jgi:enamine deaminase RidA (YjgF/YER057c/UK114 family)